MPNTSGRRAGWGQGTFDALIVALGRGASDTIVRKRLDELKRKDVAMSTIVAKVRSSQGGAAAARVQQLVSDGSIVVPRSSPPKPPHRVTRAARLKRRFAALTEEIEEAFSGIARRIGAAFGPRRRRRRKVRRVAGTAEAARRSPKDDAGNDAPRRSGRTHVPAHGSATVTGDRGRRR